jgi:hypothetical protein
MISVETIGFMKMSFHKNELSHKVLKEERDGAASD